MTDEKVIQVTPNVKECLKILKEAMEKIEDTDLKASAEGALDYLERTAAGESQPEEGRRCPPPRNVIN